MKRFVYTAAALLEKQTICESECAIDALIEMVLEPLSRLRILSFVNAHAVMRAMRDQPFRNTLLQSDVLLRDGVGMSVLVKRAGCEPGLNMNGTDFIPRLLSQAPREVKLALIGTREPRLGAAANHLRAMGFSQIITADGFQPDPYYVDLVRAEAPGLVILAMGMPKQERVAMRLASDTTCATQDMLVVNGGAILDFLSGVVPRAPDWMRRAGLEWLYRLLREPVRLFPRFRDSLVFSVLTHFHVSAIRGIMTSVDTQNIPLE